MQLVILDFGNVAIVAAAAALLGSGFQQEFATSQLAKWAIVALVLLTGWDTVIGVVGGATCEGGFRALLISPSALVSAASMLGLMGACIYRYQKNSLPFVVIAFFYAVLQLPAYASFISPKLLTARSADYVYFALAFGKILYTVSLLTALFDSAQDRRYIFPLAALNALFSIVVIGLKLADVLKVSIYERVLRALLVLFE